MVAPQFVDQLTQGVIQNSPVGITPWETSKWGPMDECHLANAGGGDGRNKVHFIYSRIRCSDLQFPELSAAREY